MRLLLLVPLAFLVAACESPGKNTCTPYAHAVASSATPPASCDGVCTSSLALSTDAGDGGRFDLCTVDCTDAGDAVCGPGTSCVSAAPISSSSYCLITCGDDAGTCPGPLTCYDAGFCL